MRETPSTTFDCDWYLQAEDGAEYGGVRAWSLQDGGDADLGG